MRRTGTRKTRLARLAGPAVGVGGAYILTMLVLVPIHVGDPRPAEASPASQPSAPETRAATRPQRADDPATRPVLHARSGIAIFYLAHADAQSLAQILQQLPVDDTLAVVPDPRTNCVIVSGSALAIERARLLIARLDIPLTTRPVVVVVGSPASRSATAPAKGPVSTSRPADPTPGAPATRASSAPAK